jgi:hypothetical protein
MANHHPIGFARKIHNPPNRPVTPNVISTKNHAARKRLKEKLIALDRLIKHAQVGFRPWKSNTKAIKNSGTMINRKTGASGGRPVEGVTAYGLMVSLDGNAFPHLWTHRTSMLTEPPSTWSLQFETDRRGLRSNILLSRVLREDRIYRRDDFINQFWIHEFVVVLYIQNMQFFELHFAGILRNQSLFVFLFHYENDIRPL